MCNYILSKGLHDAIIVHLKEQASAQCSLQLYRLGWARGSCVVEGQLLARLSCMPMFEVQQASDLFLTAAGVIGADRGLSSVSELGGAPSCRPKCCQQECYSDSFCRENYESHPGSRKSK